MDAVIYIGGTVVGLAVLGFVIEKLKKAKTVSDVTAKFDAMVSDLEGIETKARAAVDDHTAMIAEHNDAIAAHTAEATAAANVKANIKALVSPNPPVPNQQPTN